jgi:hypothetical protein
MRLIIVILLSLIIQVFGDNIFREKTEKTNNEKSRKSEYEINSNRKNFIISSIPNNNNNIAFRFMAQDDSNAYSMNYKIYDTNVINDLVSTQYTIKIHKLIQYIENPDSIPGYDTNDTICNNMYSPYDIGRARFLFFDDGIINVDNQNIKQVRAVDSNNIISFVYKFGIGNTTVGWQNNRNRQFINANSVKFDMLINTTNVNNFYANNIQCRNKNSSEIKLALLSYTKLKNKYLTSNNQTDNENNENNENNNSKYRTDVYFGSKAGFFTWENNVDTNNGIVNVLASPLQKINSNDEDNDENEEDEDVKRVIWSFDTVKPEYIFWDPVIGMMESGEIKMIINKYVLMIIILMVIGNYIIY